MKSGGLRIGRKRTNLDLRIGLQSRRGSDLL
jgi:hypothetical protein